MISSVLGPTAAAAGAGAATGAAGAAAAETMTGAGAVTGAGGGGRRGGRGAVFDEADDVAQGRVVAEIEVVVAVDRVALADGGEHLGLLDRVDPEVGLEVELGVEHVGRVTGLGGDDLQDRGRDLLGARPDGSGGGRRGRDRRRRRGGRGDDDGCRGRDRRGRRRWRRARRGGGGGRGGRGAVFDEADDVAQGRVVAEIEGVVAVDRVALADGGEHLGLLDRVDPEVGLEVRARGRACRPDNRSGRRRSPGSRP